MLATSRQAPRLCLLRPCHAVKSYGVWSLTFDQLDWLMLRTPNSTSVLRCPFPGVQAISAHFLWLSFLTEQWAIISRLRDARTAAARVMYGRLLAASLQDPAVLSHHPAAVGAYFRLLSLGLKYGRSCLRGGPATAGKDVLLLFDRILQAVSRRAHFGAETAGHCRAAGSVPKQAFQ